LATAYLADWCRRFAKNKTAYDKPYPWINGFERDY